MKPIPVITKHAIERYQQRVDTGASTREAAIAISEILDRAAVSSRPRHWSRVVAQAPGTRYLYAADRPGVCLVVAGAAVVTVYSRPVCAAWRRDMASWGRPRSSRPRLPEMLRFDWRLDAA